MPVTNDFEFPKNPTPFVAGVRSSHLPPRLHFALLAFQSCHPGRHCFADHEPSVCFPLRTLQFPNREKKHVSKFHIKKTSNFWGVQKCSNSFPNIFGQFWRVIGASKGPCLPSCRICVKPKLVTVEVSKARMVFTMACASGGDLMVGFLCIYTYTHACPNIVYVYYLYIYIHNNNNNNNEKIPIIKKNNKNKIKNNNNKKQLSKLYII